MSYTQFQFGFWHPFGQHGGEKPEHILERKKEEIKANGWTLWSFQWRRQAYLDAWCKQLARADAVYVFCSDGQGAKDPPHSPSNCKSYRHVGDTTWNLIPEAIHVPHPFRRQQKEATAFKVEKIIYPVDLCVLPTVEWFWLDDSGKDLWRQDAVPTRGEYLIKPGGGAKMRGYRAVLVLKKPYLVVVDTETNETAGGSFQG
jgi:hypothetical protein